MNSNSLFFRKIALGFKNGYDKKIELIFDAEYNLKKTQGFQGEWLQK